MQELRESVIPSKAKDFYEKLLLSISQILETQDFTQRASLMEKLNDHEDIKADFIEHLRRDLAIEFLIASAPLRDSTSFLYLKALEEELMPFPFLLEIVLIGRRYTRAESYSTPSIDLNVALRLCLAIGSLVLAPREKNLRAPPLLDWTDLPLNWKETLVAYIKSSRVSSSKKKKSFFDFFKRE